MAPESLRNDLQFFRMILNDTDPSIIAIRRVINIVTEVPDESSDRRPISPVL